MQSSRLCSFALSIMASLCQVVPAYADSFISATCDAIDTNALEIRVKTQEKELAAVSGIRESHFKVLADTADLMRMMQPIKPLASFFTGDFSFLIKELDSLASISSSDEPGTDVDAACMQRIPSLGDDSKELALRISQAFYTKSAEKYGFTNIKNQLHAQVYRLQKACRALVNEQSSAPDEPTLTMIWQALQDLNRILRKIDQTLAKFEEDAAMCKAIFATPSAKKTNAIVVPRKNTSMSSRKAE